MELDLDDHRPSLLHRLLAWFGGFLLTGWTHHRYNSVQELAAVPRWRLGIATAELSVVGGGLYYLFGVMSPGFTRLLVGVALGTLGLWFLSMTFAYVTLRVGLIVSDLPHPAEWGRTRR